MTCFYNLVFTHFPIERPGDSFGRDICFGRFQDRFVAVAGLDARFAAGEPECAAGSAQVAEEGPEVWLGCKYGV